MYERVRPPCSAYPLSPGAELRPLEPWQAAEFAAHVAAARDHLAPWLPWARTVVDTESARAFLQRRRWPYLRHLGG